MARTWKRSRRSCQSCDSFFGRPLLSVPIRRKCWLNISSEIGILFTGLVSSVRSSIASERSAESGRLSTYCAAVSALRNFFIKKMQGFHPAKITNKNKNYEKVLSVSLAPFLVECPYYFLAPPLEGFRTALVVLVEFEQVVLVHALLVLEFPAYGFE